MSNIPYTQVKVSVDPTVAASFKSACATENISMATVLTQYMAKHSNIVLGKKSQPALSTKRQRRAAVLRVIQQLERIKVSEETYLDRIPENLRSSDAFENADHWISALDEAIDLLASLE